MRTRAYNRLWHDDIRRVPKCGRCGGSGDWRGHTCPECEGLGSSWYWARTNKDAVLFLLAAERAGEPCLEASLDHDLGLENEDPDAPAAELRRGSSLAGNGVDLAMAMYYLRIAPPKVTIHSWNERAGRMADILRDAGSEVEIVPYRAPGMDDLTYAAMFRDWPK